MFLFVLGLFYKEMVVIAMNSKLLCFMRWQGSLGLLGFRVAAVFRITRDALSRNSRGFQPPVLDPKPHFITPPTAPSLALHTTDVSKFWNGDDQVPLATARGSLIHVRLLHEVE